MDSPGGCLLTAAAVALVVLSLPAAVSAQQAGPVPAELQEAIDPDGVLLAVDLQADGSAVWRIEYRVRLDDENSTQAFESVRAEIDAGPASFSGPFGERMAATAATAENATGREMGIGHVTVSAEVRQLPQTYGVVTYRFVWDGFAAVEGDRLRAGDAIGGLFLDGESRLLVSWPDGYRLVEAAPTPQDAREGSAAWAGPVDFAAGEPEIVVSSASAAGSTAGTGPGDGTDDGGIPWLALASVAVIALLAAAGWFIVSRRDGATIASSGPSEELLSNEERVLRLLEEAGGRMKQQEVAAELGWTDARTSQVVGNLREDGEIESFRLGRENVLSLPGYDES